MAPIPPMLIRLATAFLTTALTRRLQQSPAFFRMVDRLVHEADHFPARMQGKPVPPYINRDPQEPTMSEQAQEAWRRQVEDPGEPHDEPDPFRSPNSANASSPSSSSSSSSSRSDPLLQRQRAQDSFRAAQKNAQKSREKQAQDQDTIRRQNERDQMRDLLEKIRQGK